jgi:hypothetical protein
MVAQMRLNFMLYVHCLCCYCIVQCIVFITLSSSDISVCGMKVISTASISHLYFLIFHHLLRTCPCLWKHLLQFRLITFFMICMYVCFSLFPFILLRSFFKLYYMATLLPSSSSFLAYGMTSCLTL